ncbi:MAG: ATP-dependent DNA helicase RecG [Anaerolineaceae bacterium]|nr:ATP-dependent DNA helicase RecG [Anaerolineaceae bacterium]
MLLPIEKLQKFLDLEVDRGFDNKAVVGGLDKIVPLWEKEARHSKIQTEIIQSISSLLKTYNNLDSDSRKDLISEINEKIKQIQNQPDQSDDNIEIRTKEENIDKKSLSSLTKDQTKPHKSDQNAKTSHVPKSEHNQIAVSEIHELNAPLTVINGIGNSNASKLSDLGLESLNDLIYNFPRKYDDYSKLKPINKLSYGEEVTIIGTIKSIFDKAIKGKPIKLTEAVFTDGTGSLRLTWFNQPWIIHNFSKNDHIVVSGKIDMYLGRFVITNPECEKLEKENLHTNRIVPIYSLTARVTQRWLRRIIFNTIKFWTPKIEEYIPAHIIQKESLIQISEALYNVHFPKNERLLRSSQYRLAFDEILFLQLGVLLQKRNWQNRKGTPISVTDDFIDLQKAKLPYQLTTSQTKAVDDIRGDFLSGHPMNRLLQGDVGSGKTVVAAIAISMAVNSKTQSAIMAPTSILAEQHYEILSDLLTANYAENPAILESDEICLLTGSTSDKEKQVILQDLANGKIKLIIGTHALIEESVHFQNLKFIIIDEQHRFGVGQRGKLRNKGHNPHLLVMTATPIPRSLSLTLYGDLDISVMDELPAGRQEISTHIMHPRERERAYQLILSQIEKGNQCYLVYPLIENEEDEHRKAAVNEFERLQKDVFLDIPIGLLHGKMKSIEKEDIMRKFRDGEIKILVSTTVIEVGVDVKNATTILIEGANRFGLAQLHQLRGRVGRGNEQSFCLLIPENENALENERLKVMTETNNGFILADKDLKQRGPGQFLGTRQSGFTELKMASITDVSLISRTRRIANRLLDSDSDLSSSEHKELKHMVDRFWSSKGEIS